MRVNSKFHIFLLLICFPVISAHAQIRRCANPNPPYTVPENMSFKKTTGTIISIPVIFHVIYDNNGNGNVQETKLQAQVDTLNATHSRFGSLYRFYLSAITRTNNTNWWDIDFNERSPGQNDDYPVPSQTEIDMTNALAIDPTHAFNIYVSRLLSDLCGWTIYFPWEVSEASKQNGIIIDYRTLPGGEYNDFNYGYTAVHEGGHYLGLYHTFQNNCTPPGDEVDDTPYQDKSYNYVCNDLLDTCPSSPGNDPVHNYLNYTDDRCYNNFTAGQISRIASITGQYKPNLGGTTLVFTSTYIVGNSSSLKIFPGMTLQFTSGSSLTVNGTLTANGNLSSTPITFNRNGTSGTWGGIQLNSGSSGSTISYCIIRYADKGIYENGVSVNVSYSAISNCTNGIYLYNSNPTIQGCNIHNNTSYGINMLYCSSSPYPTLKENYIRYNDCGVFCAYSSLPIIGQNSSIGNKISYNNYGVIVFNNAIPKIGDGTYGGYNNFINNSVNGVLNTTGNVVYAQHNWWNNNPNIGGNVLCTNPLPDSVNVPLPTLSKTSGNLAASEVEDIPMLSELDKAYELVVSNNLAEARTVCLNLINNYPDYSVSYNALNLLKETYSEKDLTAKKDIYKSVFNKESKKDLYAMAGLILSDIDKENRLKHLDDVIETYKGESVIELALFDKLVYYYFELNDVKSARIISDELDKQFPESMGSIEAHKILGDEKYFGINAEYQALKKTTTSTTPTVYALYDNYPNPFNPSTTIKFQIPKEGYVTLKVYDILGREVASLVNENIKAGSYSYNFDASKLSSGVYIYKITANDFVQSKKMLLVK